MKVELCISHRAFAGPPSTARAAVLFCVRTERFVGLIMCLKSNIVIGAIVHSVQITIVDLAL